MNFTSQERTLMQPFLQRWYDFFAEQSPIGTLFLKERAEACALCSGLLSIDNFETGCDFVLAKMVERYVGSEFDVFTENPAWLISLAYTTVGSVIVHHIHYPKDNSIAGRYEYACRQLHFMERSRQYINHATDVHCQNLTYGEYAKYYPNLAQKMISKFQKFIAKLDT